MSLKQFSTFNTWYCPGGGTSESERRLEGGPFDRKGAPAYTLEQYLEGKAPYVTVAMDSNAFPYGTTVYNGKFKDSKGNLIPFRVTDTGGAFKNMGTQKMDIASSSLQRAREGPNFSGVWQVAGASNIIPAPSPNSPGIQSDPNNCEGLSNSGLAAPNQFNINNSPPPSNGSPLPPIGKGGGGVTTNYIPEELKAYGNGRLPTNILTPLTFARGFLYKPAADSFEKMVADYKGTGNTFPGITDHYRPIEVQLRLAIEKPRLAARPGTSMHGWGLAIDFNNNRQPVNNWDPFLQFLKTNAHKYGIYGLAAVKGDAFYSQGFWRGEEWHWEFRGLQNQENVLANAPQQFQGSQKDYYDKVYNAVYEEAKARGLPNPEVIAQLGAAQSSLETGYGKSMPPGSFNAFGIKGSGPAGTVVTATNEVINGQTVRINDGFRRYNNFNESAKDYVDFLIVNGRYRPVLGATTFRDAAIAIGNSGYATDPTYGQVVASIGNRFGSGSVVASN